MKKTICVLFVLFAATAFCAATGSSERSAEVSAAQTAEDPSIAREKADMSYAFGMFVASDLLDTGLEFDYEAFTHGFRDVMEDERTRFTGEEAIAILQAAFDRLNEQEEELFRLEAERNLAQGNAFLTANRQRPGVIVTTSGLQIELISEGTGEIPNIADTVKVHYQGSTIDGFVFDSSYEYGEPLDLPLDRVIPGWSEGLRMMREGAKAILYIPPDLAYGERGVYGLIAPNSVLIFEVEFLEIIR